MPTSPETRQQHYSPLLERGVGYAWRLTIIIVALVLAGWVVIQLRVAIISLILGMFIASLLIPATAWLEAKGWRPVWATTVTFTSFLALAGGLIILLIQPFISGLTDIAPALQKGVGDVLRNLEDGPLGFLAVGPLDNPGAQFESSFSQTIINGLSLVGEVLAIIAASLVFTFFIVMDRVKIRAWCLSLFPEDRRDLAERMGSSAWRTIGLYWQGRAVISLFDALALGLAMLIFQVPLVLPLVILTFILAFIPYLGNFPTGGLAIVLALVAQGWLAALGILVAIIIIQSVDGNIVGPLVLGKAFEVHPLVVLIALIVGTTLGGVIGAFLGVPVTAAVIAVVREYRKDGTEDPSEE